MTSAMKLRRSFFYAAPAHAPMMELARSVPADLLCLDLEDSTPPAAKSAARDTIAEWLREGRPKAREVLVRVNTLDTEWGYRDLRFAAALGIDGVLLPKVEGSGSVRQALRILSSEVAYPPRLWCLIESPLGVLRAEEIAACDIEGIVVGGADLAEGLGVRHVASRLPLWHALSQIVLTARAYDRAVIDAMFTGPRDDVEGLQASCVQGAEMGFDGKSVFSAEGVRLANRHFAPSEAEVTKARAMIDGAGGYGGHVDYARRVLARHDAATTA